MKYVVQYRPRVAHRSEKDPWKDTEEFDSVDDANLLRDDCIKYEMKGTKDWRVMPKP